MKRPQIAAKPSKTPGWYSDMVRASARPGGLSQPAALAIADPLDHAQAAPRP